MANFEDMVILCKDREKTSQFLTYYKVINSHAICQRCGSEMTRAHTALSSNVEMIMFIKTIIKRQLEFHSIH